MAITDKARKTLWARSGNRCAICRIELVADKNQHDKNLNIGDECHIISEKENGPRYKRDFKNVDSYENLILLCKNHHRQVDELWETFTIEILRTVKINHELWIKVVIDQANSSLKKGTNNNVLKRITTGKQLLDIIFGVEANQYDHDELQTQEEVSLIGGFLQNLQDYGDIISLEGMEKGEQIQLSFDLNKDIKNIEDCGFFIFGERKSSKMTNANKEDLGTWDIAVVSIVRKNNPAIVDMQKLTVNVKPFKT